ncbi:geranyl transferase [Brachyspira aalborgi]|uniref:Geranyl transferase n=1 Tax=Brachyspira aalborgi TaxID=29522 RepID=A0A5C8FI05_9SPIR|nr:geranyl transferase [Brachyspira aalborgi]TXJ49329.1 geranyl transferase [Brachyspira aalborgi]
MEQGIIDNLPNILKNSTDTLKNISYDNINDEYITNSQKVAIDFDKVKNLYNNKNNNSFELKSNDALYIVKNNIYYFIEFKNGDLKDYKNKLSYTIKKDLQLKIYDSWFILSDIEYLDGKKYISNMFSLSKNCIVYILVYNSKKNGKLIIHERFLNNGKQNLNGHKSRKIDLELFGLAKFEKFLLKEVYIYDENEFETKFINGTIANEP